MSSEDFRLLLAIVETVNSITMNVAKRHKVAKLKRSAFSVAAASIHLTVDPRDGVPHVLKVKM